MAQCGPVEAATRAELRSLGVSVQTSSLAAAMVSLARQMDTSRGAAAAAAAGTELRQARAAMIEERNSQPTGDVIDELNARRADRRPAAEAVERPGVVAERGGAGRASG